MKLLDTENQLAETFQAEEVNIPIKRKEELSVLSSVIMDHLDRKEKAEIVVICTHNSRRSHIGQLMLKLAAYYYEIDSIRTYSGGTEATAFNSRVVDALVGLGISVDKLNEGSNPKYHIPLVEQDLILDIHFSKPYDNSYNPQKGFIAVMVCNSADEACPIVTGAEDRISLPYIDPKVSDDTDEEKETYKKKIMEIGGEMFYVISKIKSDSK